MKSKFIDTDDELLAGDISPKKSHESSNALSETDKKDQELLMRFVDTYSNELAECHEFYQDLVGKNLENMSSHIVYMTDVDGQTQQYLIEKPFNGFHIGQSLHQHKTVAMTIINPNLVKGRPTAEFLPGELRNKDYVKGDMASDIYQKTVKGPLGQRGLPKR